MKKLLHFIKLVIFWFAVGTVAAAVEMLVILVLSVFDKSNLSLILPLNQWLPIYIIGNTLMWWGGCWLIPWFKGEL